MTSSLFGIPKPFPESGLMAETRTWTFAAPPDELSLIGGGRLGPVTVAYQTYGGLNAAGDNGVLVCHSLTGDCHAAGRMAGREVAGWWDPLIGPGRAFDTSRCFVVCANVLGGWGGTTCAASINPETGRPYGSAFPRVTVRDMATVHAELLRHLGVSQLAVVSGPSMGGSQAWEFAAAFPEKVRACIPVAGSPVASAALIGWNAVCRRAITSDPGFQGGDYYGTGRAPDQGMALARQIATMTYSSPSYFEEGFGHSAADGGGPLPNAFAVDEYLAEEGRKLVARFDANAYLSALDALDTMDIGRSFGGLDAAFEAMQARLLAIGVSSDLLFPPGEIRAAVETARRAGLDARYAEIESQDGHDACLLEMDRVGGIIKDFLREDAALA